MALADADKKNFEITVVGTYAALGGQAQNTFTPLAYRRTNFGAPFNATAVITAFHAQCKANWKLAVSANWSWVKTSIRCLNSPTELATEVTVGEVGAIAGDSLPGYACAVIHKGSSLRGRSFNGRCYIPGIGESSTTGNALTAGAQALFDALATDLKTGITDAGGVNYVPAILSRKLSDLVIDPSVVVMTDTASTIARSVLGRLSSRKSTV